MDFVQNISYLQYFWSIQLMITIPSVLWMLSSGGYLEKLKNPTAATQQKLGWFQFRKRLGRYHLVAVIWIGYLLWQVAGVWCLNHDVSDRVISAFNVITEPRQVNTDKNKTIAALVLLFLHVTRRLYGNMFINICSWREMLNPLDIILAYAYYIGVGFTLLAEAPPLKNTEECFDYKRLGQSAYVGIALFLVASFIHTRCHNTLAALRRNRAGHIVSTEYKQPMGGLFSVVSCPHYLAEVLIYVAIGLVLGLANRSWWLLTAYVFVNHLYLAINTHNMYTKRFANYPANKKCLVPLIM